MKIKQTTTLFATIAIAVLGFAFVLFGSPSTVSAAGACGTGNNDISCVSDNCSAISSYLSASECGKIVSACENTRVVGGGINQTILFNDTAQGNCSNAIRSCFENEVNNEACKYNEVLALATQCNNGDMNADGVCGMDAAIDKYNEYDNEKDLTNNKGAKSQYLDNQVKEACKNSANLAEQRSCESLVRDRVNDCYKQNGKSARRKNGKNASAKKWKATPGSSRI